MIKFWNFRAWVVLLGLGVSAGSGFNLCAGEKPVVAAELLPKVPTNRLIFGLNGNIRHALAGELFDQAVRVASPSIIRYPGGTWSACWDWQRQTVFDREHIVDWMNKDAVWLQWIMPVKPTFDADASKGLTRMGRFVRLASSVDAEISWVLNFNSDTVDNAVGMVDHLASKGYPVRFVELGNEYNGRSFNRRFPTVAGYLAEADEIIDRLQSTYPDLRLGYPSDLPMESLEDADQTEQADADSMRGRDWDATLAGRDDGIRLVDHHYVGFPPHRSEANAERFQRYEAANRDEKIRFYLLSPQMMVDGMEAWLLQHGARGKKVWFTEFNMWLNSGPTAAFSDTMVNALYMASWQLCLLSRERFEMAMWHSLLGENFGFIGASEGKLTVTPAVQVFSRLSRMAKDSTTMRPVRFLGAPEAGDAIAWGGATRSLLQGVLFQKASGGELVLLNLGPQPVSVELPPSVEPGARVEGLSGVEPDRPLRVDLGIYDSAVGLDHPVASLESRVHDDRKVDLAPYSFTIVSY